MTCDISFVPCNWRDRLSSLAMHIPQNRSVKQWLRTPRNGVEI